MATQTELDALSWDALNQQKADLESRLARFQQAFHSKHGRNPAGEELAPAKPAIKRYRAVCKEISVREQEAAELYASQQQGGGSGGSGAAGMAEQAVTGAQQAGLAANIAVSGGAVERAMTRQPTRGASGGDTQERAGAAAGSCGQADAGAVQGAVDGAAAGSVSGGASSGTDMMSFLPSTGTIELVANGLQYLQLSYTLLAQGVARMAEKLPDFDLEITSPWSLQWSSWLGWLSIFNLDFEMLSLYYDDLAHLKYISWETKFVVVVIVVPGFIALTTVLLIKSITEIVWLAVLILSVLALVFSLAATNMVPQERAVIMEAYTQELSFTTMGGVIGLALCLASYALYYIYTLIQVRRLLEREVEDISDKLNGMMEGDGGAGGKGEVQESQLHAADIADMIGGREAMSASEFVRQMKEQEQAKLHGDGPRMPTLWTFFKTLALWLVISIVCLIAWLKRWEALPASAQNIMPLQAAELDVIAWVTLSLSILILLYKFVSLSPGGIKFLEAAKNLFKAGYVGYLMVISSLLYIPVTKMIVSVWICDQKRCATGEWYPLPSPTFNLQQMFSPSKFVSEEDLLDSLAGQSGQCEPCAFLSSGRVADGSCPAAFSDRLCPELQTSRLRASPSLDCLSEVWPYYGTAAMLMILCFTVGVPVVYYELVKQHSNRYASLDVFAIDGGRHGGGKGRGSVAARGSESPVPGGNKRRSLVVGKKAPDGRTDDERNEEWARRVKPSRMNKAKNLYADFEYKWRFWKLVVLLQKLLLVFVVMFAVDEPLVAAVLMGIIHLGMFAITCYARPYMDSRPDQLSIAISFANVFNAVMAACAFAQVPMPESMAAVLLVVNIGFPILALLWGWYLNVAARKRRRKADPSYKGLSAFTAAAEGEEVKKQRRLVERNINEYTLRFLVSWTMAVVLCSCLAAGMISIGSFAKVVTTPVQGPASKIPSTVAECAKEEFMRKMEYGEFSSWATFTDHCCCMPRTNAAANATVGGFATELWACTGGNASAADRVTYKERPRRSAAMDEVSPLRPFCGLTFYELDGVTPLANQEPVWRPDLAKFAIPYTDADGKQQFFVEYW